MSRNYLRRTLRHRIPNILQITACERRCNVLGINVCETKIYELNMQKCLSDINYIRVNIVCSLVQALSATTIKFGNLFLITHFENICKSDLPCISFKPLYNSHLGLTEESGRCREVAVSGSLTVVEKSIECEKNVLTIELTVFYLR